MTLFLRLLAETDKTAALAEVCSRQTAEGGDPRVFEVAPESFDAVPGKPFAYWVSEAVRETFRRLPAFESEGRTVKQGLATADDFRFVRAWWEAPSSPALLPGGEGSQSPSPFGRGVGVRAQRWFPFAKGGSFSPFYADVYLCVNWADGGREVRAFDRSFPRNETFFLRPGLTWPSRPHRRGAFSHVPPGCIFSHTGTMMFLPNEQHWGYLSLLNSDAYIWLLHLLMPRGGQDSIQTLKYEIGYVKSVSLPCYHDVRGTSLASLARRAWSLKRTLDTLNETSHAFLLPAGLNEQITGLDAGAIQPLLSDHEAFLHRTGGPYYFVRTLDCCARALCDRFPLRDPEVQSRLFQWIHLALRMDAENPRLWMLWELALRKAGFPQRAQWVLWEMTRRFPDNRPCRVELARLLAASSDPDDQRQAQRLLRQVLRLNPDHLHAHSTLAQLAIRRGDWEAALGHARDGLRIKPDDGVSVMLLAQAHARRNDLGDLQAAIDHLQRFILRYPGDLKAEGYRDSLQRRQQLAGEGQLTPLDEEEMHASSTVAEPEADPIWRAFAESTRAWVAEAAAEGASAGSQSALPDRVLPLPQALRRAAANGEWGGDPLDSYDEAVRQEFPLETRLWRYLQTFQPSASEAERERARSDVQAWLDIEARTPSQDSPSWLPYLNQRWDVLRTPSDDALASGAEWLEELLDRHQTLPAPLAA